MFDHVAQRHEHEAKTRGVSTFGSHVDEAADQVTADPGRIEQVVDNLVANAIRHTPPDGRVEMSATTGGAIIVTVADSGAGIPPEHLAFVFDRFYKVDQARANGSEGSGLGLSISKAIVESHGGTMTVTSAPGRTVFTFTLPQNRRELKGTQPDALSRERQSR